MSHALRTHWSQQLGWLSSCAVAADVGSGPAILPRMLIRHHGTALAALHWICIDSAHWPGAHAGLPGTRLSLRTGQNFVDALPPPGGVDGLVSNFGLEYVPRERAAEACWAWLAGGARLHAVMHAKGSVIDRAAMTHLDDIAFALTDAQLFDRASAMLQALATAPSDPVERMMHAIDVRDAYNAAVNALKARMEAARLRSEPLIDMLQGITALTGPARTGQLESALAGLARREADYRAECARLEAMRQAALDEVAVTAFHRALSEAGLRDVTGQLLDSPAGPVGWIVSARKP